MRARRAQVRARCLAHCACRSSRVRQAGSGYVGVQHIASKKRPWQATLKPPGRKRLNVGCYRTEQEAALARAQAKAEGSDILPSPRKQAVCSSGARSLKFFFFVRRETSILLVAALVVLLRTNRALSSRGRKPPPVTMCVFSIR